MSENYWGTNVPVGKSETELRHLIGQFGATRYGIIEDWDKGTVTIMFEFDNLPIKIDLSVEKIVKTRLEAEPYNSYRRCSEEEYQSKIRDQAKKVGMRILVNRVKAELLAVEYGIVTPEEVFLSHFVTRSGKTIGQELIPGLGDKLMNPARLLGAGGK